MKHCGTQELETERLVLRRLSIDDSEMMYNNWANDRQVTQYLRWNATAAGRNRRDAERVGKALR